MKTIYLSLFFGLLFTGCHKIIQLDLNEGEKHLIVDAKFTSFTQAHEVKLSYSSNFYSADSPELVSGANVTVTDGINTYTYNEVSPGLYQTVPTASATINQLHTLKIDVDGTVYEGSNFCDTVPALDTVVVEPNFVNGSSTEIQDYSIKISTQELPGFGDRYAWNIYINGVLYNDSLTEQLSLSDEYFADATYFYLVELTSLSKDKLQSGDTVMVAQHRISKETYDNYQAILQQTEYTGGIFDAPPANIPSNINNNAMGWFSCSGEVRNFTIVP